MHKWDLSALHLRIKWTLLDLRPAPTANAACWRMFPRTLREAIRQSKKMALIEGQGMRICIAFDGECTIELCCRTDACCVWFNPPAREQCNLKTCPPSSAHRSARTKSRWLALGPLAW